jgi:hypothetical protein
MVLVVKRQAESRADTASYIQIMYILTYLKIICTQQGQRRQLQRYRDSLLQTGLIQTLIELYVFKDLNNRGNIF